MPPRARATQTIMINRAAVLTLWAAVVAERRGLDWGDADGDYQETARMLGARSRYMKPVKLEEVPDPVRVIR